MDSPWSPASTYSEAESCIGQSKPGMYLIVKMSQNGTFDYSSSSKEVAKMMTEKLRSDVEECMKIAHQRSHPDVSNHYGQMLKECEALHLRDPHAEDVKDLRHFIPLFRKVGYIGRDDIEKKFKLKSMWSEKPSDWPADVCHVDPNNPGADNGKKRLKPKKPELIKMFNHLTQRYRSVREMLWINTFSCRPDENIDVKTEMKDDFDDLYRSELQGLADQVEQIYGNDRSISKLLKALMKEIVLMDTISDPKRWVVYNRQKSILEADLREAVYMHRSGAPHMVNDVVTELKGICKHLSIDPGEVLLSLEEDQPEGMIPAILDQARPPTSGMRKRKPTLNLDMEGGMEHASLSPMVPVVTNSFNLSDGSSLSEDSVYLEEMDVGNNVDIFDSTTGTTFDNGPVTMNNEVIVENNHITEGQRAVEALENNYPPQIYNAGQEQMPNFAQLDPGQPVDIGWGETEKKAQPVSSLQDIFEVITSSEEQHTIPQTINEDDLNDLINNLVYNDTQNLVYNDVMLSSQIRN